MARNPCIYNVNQSEVFFVCQAALAVRSTSQAFLLKIWNSYRKRAISHCLCILILFIPTFASKLNLDKSQRKWGSLSLSLSLSDFFSICHPRWSSRKIGVVIEVHGESRRYFETNPSYLHEPPDSLPGHSANRLRICSSVCKYIQSPFTFNLHTLVALIIK